MPHDQAAAITEIKGLSVNARNALSHILRNGLMNLLAANNWKNAKVEAEINRVDKELREIGL